MGIQINAGTLVHAIAASEITEAARKTSQDFQELLVGLLADFAASAPTP